MLKDSFFISIEKHGDRLWIKDRVSGDLEIYTNIVSSVGLMDAIADYSQNRLRKRPAVIVNTANYLEEAGYNKGYKLDGLYICLESWYYNADIADMMTLAALFYAYGMYYKGIEIDWEFVDITKHYLMGGGYVD